MRVVYNMPGFHELQGFINCFLCSITKPLTFYLSKPDVRVYLRLGLNRQSGRWNIIAVHEPRAPSS